MRRLFPLALLAACTGDGVARPAPPPAGAPRAAAVRAAFLADMDSLDAAVARLGGERRRDSLQARFLEARLAYKRVEHLVELYAPTSADGINGPAIDEVEEDDPNRFVIPAEGFQVVEELLFPRPDTAGLAEEVAILGANVRRVRGMMAASPVTDDAVWDAARQQLARVSVLGLAGFDAPLSGRSVPEAAHSLRAVRRSLAPYAADLLVEDAAAWRALDERLSAAVAYLDAHPDFASFDRLAFLAGHVRPAAHALAAARAALGIAHAPDRRAWRAAAATPFEPGAFDALAFAPGGAETTPERVELGRRLFFDPVLSGDGRRSCATCHAPDRGFADGRARPPGTHGRPLERNAPTVVNAGLQAGTFYDLRTAFLEDQVADVVRNPDEMHGDLDAVAARLRAHAGYAAHFRRAFPGRGVDAGGVREAVAAYVRSLEALDSRWDRAVRGDAGAISTSERRGFNLFMGRATCGTCHFAPLFNGTVPPAYAEAEVEILGVPATPAGRRLDPDPGRARVTGIELHRHAFKTPTLRNVALTAPYMHNGAFRTLEEVVDFYDRGGGAGLGLHVPHQTLPSDRLHLTPRDRADLVAFMRALTDTTY